MEGVYVTSWSLEPFSTYRSDCRSDSIDAGDGGIGLNLSTGGFLVVDDYVFVFEFEIRVCGLCFDDQFPVVSYPCR